MAKITLNINDSLVAEVISVKCKEFEPKTLAQVKKNILSDLRNEVIAKRERLRPPVDTSDINIT